MKKLIAAVLAAMLFVCACAALAEGVDYAIGTDCPVIDTSELF